MSEPLTASIAAYLSAAKIWSIIAGVCGSIIPILALADRTRITLINGFFMALTGSSFSVFVGPWLSQRLDISSIEGTVALSWIMGAGGVYLVRAVLNYLDKRGATTVEALVNKTLGISTPSEPVVAATPDTPPVPTP
jgi:uncharacterized membrane protein YdcZ (DUF606 family)